MSVEHYAGLRAASCGAGEHRLLTVPDELDFGHRRVTLAHLPTPVEPLDTLAQTLGLAAGRLFAKRDDATGLALGGNKVRKLEYLCAEALASGARHLVTAGLGQSNHCRQTAAAAAKLGLGCTVLLVGPAPDTFSGNLVLDVLYGADIRWIESADRTTIVDDLDAAIVAEADRLTAAGTPAYPVVVGGSVPLGALGYVRAGRELHAQFPDLARVFCPSGSFGTHAGLAVGLGDHDLVQGVQIGVGGRDVPEERIERLAADTATLAGLPSPRGRARLDSRHGHATQTASILEAIRLAARTEGLVLDPVYTGTVMAGLIAAGREGALPADDDIVFLHTGGGPGLLAAEPAEWLVDALASADS
jgi:1-aminocyclopropane-1-carboxylate deaminase/D-cysteine desulfhydrase-like pyridoxal-dependent ACC family enzyme